MRILSKDDFTDHSTLDKESEEVILNFLGKAGQLVVRAPMSATDPISGEDLPHISVGWDTDGELIWYTTLRLLIEKYHMQPPDALLKAAQAFAGNNEPIPVTDEQKQEALNALMQFDLDDVDS